MQKILKRVSNVITSLLIILLVCTIFIVIAMRASGAEGPKLFGYQFKTVLSGSMEPKIHTGSMIAIRPAENASHFKKGDVVTYRAEDDILITHRIVKVRNHGKQYITKGDNNNAPDTKPVQRQNIVGAYAGFTLPYVGYATNFANSRGGSALLLILPGLLLLGYACFTIWRTLHQFESSKHQNTNGNTQ